MGGEEFCVRGGLAEREEELNLLVIIVDTNPIWWGKQALKESQFTLSKCMDAVMVLGNSHLFMNRSNKLAVIASHVEESRFLYPGKHGRLGDFFGDPGNPLSDCNPSGSKDGKYELLTAANEVIVEEIKDLMTKSDIKGQHTETLLAGSLARALCYIHRMNKEVKDNQEMKSRILVIKAAEDSALQYMNFMNVVFAAQKQNILIDACVLDSDSGLLQQTLTLTACSLFWATSGSLLQRSPSDHSSFSSLYAGNPPGVFCHSEHTTHSPCEDRTLFLPFTAIAY
ncbi:general transcription factor IIH subunit 3 isoform 5-T5 [Thomomys bottae]